VLCPLLFGFVDPVAAAALTAKLPNGQYMIPAIPGVTTAAGCTPGEGATASPVLETIPSNSTYKEDQFNTNLDVKLNNANRFFGKFFFAATAPIRRSTISLATATRCRRPAGRPRKMLTNACFR
jgi:hypothetical protein